MTYQDITIYNFEKQIEKAYKEQYIEKHESFETCLSLLNRKEKEDMVAWIMRQYFSDNQKNSFWFNDKVTSENVLEFIHNKSNDFPHTLYAVIEQFKLKNQITKEISGFDDVSSVTEHVNLIGEVSLMDIGKQLNGVSPTMINKITTKALEKFKKTYLLFENPKFKKYYEDLIDEVADIYALGIIQEDSIDDFLAYLVSNDLMKTKDIEFLCEKELSQINNIIQNKSSYNFYDIESIFINDFAKEMREFSMFQYSVSRIINPHDKSGRKANETN